MPVDYPACGRQNALRLGVDDDIREPGVRPPDPLLDVAGERMSLGERAARVHRKREKGDEPGGGQLARSSAKIKTCTIEGGETIESNFLRGKLKVNAGHPSSAGRAADS